MAIPLIAGPGAITTTIIFSSQNTSADHLIAMGVAIATVALVTFLLHRYPGDLLARVRPTTIAILARFGRLLLATPGFQRFLNGLRNSFA